MGAGTPPKGTDDPDKEEDSNEDETKEEEDTEETESPSTETNLSVYEKIYGATDIYTEGDYVIIKTKGRPDHKSPYYEDTEWDQEMYEAYNGSNSKFWVNPNRIGEFNYTFKIPQSKSRCPTPGHTFRGYWGIIEWGSFL